MGVTVPESALMFLLRRGGWLKVSLDLWSAALSVLPTVVAFLIFLLPKPKFTGADAADAIREEDATLLAVVLVVAFLPGGLLTSLNSTGISYSSSIVVVY